MPLLQELPVAQESRDRCPVGSKSADIMLLVIKAFDLLSFLVFNAGLFLVGLVIVLHFWNIRMAYIDLDFKRKTFSLSNILSPHKLHTILLGIS